MMEGWDARSQLHYVNNSTDYHHCLSNWVYDPMSGGMADGSSYIIDLLTMFAW